MDEITVEVIEDHQPSLIYPQYINSKIDKAAGRRIPIAKGVEDPNIKEIFDVCCAWGAKCAPEPLKSYPRCQGRSCHYYNGGRIKVPYRTINIPPADATTDEVETLLANLERCRLDGTIEKITKREFLVRLAAGIRRYREQKVVQKPEKAVVTGKKKK
ncbi:signal recognition particle 19 kDa protein [Perkinsela sp. CCAP 1560/4]|nr:signal recognition particle 19 kDa protein [Perkinsela sp. CCAP 1560/4]|eukprot:KNH05475.1 signal recognition particle 19 kDa protein [Perkinsela sp. CCAP 1560/4]